MIAHSLTSLVDAKLIYAFMIEEIRQISPFYEECNVQLQTVMPRSITPLSRYAVTYRLDRAHRVLSAMIDRGLEPYELFCLDNGSVFRLVLPPIVELSTTGAFLIDGTHRLLAVLNSGIMRITVVGVAGCKLPPLPCETTEWDAIVVSPEQKPLEEVLVPLRREFFRPATRYCNSDRFCFRTLPDIINYITAVSLQKENGNE